MTRPRPIHFVRPAGREGLCSDYTACGRRVSRCIATDERDEANCPDCLAGRRVYR